MSRRAPDTMPLYPSEEQISTAVLGPGKLQEWRALAQVLERHGLPPKDETVGARYYPAVRAYFDRRHRVAIIAGTAPKGENVTWERKRPDSDGGIVPTAGASRIGSRETT